jgi:hypothetical protein
MASSWRRRGGCEPNRRPAPRRRSACRLVRPSATTSALGDAEVVAKRRSRGCVARPRGRPGRNALDLIPELLVGPFGFGDDATVLIGAGVAI